MNWTEIIRFVAGCAGAGVVGGTLVMIIALLILRTQPGLVYTVSMSGGPGDMVVNSGQTYTSADGKWAFTNSKPYPIYIKVAKNKP